MNGPICLVCCVMSNEAILYTNKYEICDQPTERSNMSIITYRIQNLIIEIAGKITQNKIYGLHSVSLSQTVVLVSSNFLQGSINAVNQK